tara:strand:+ start:92 stop:220 length:129 start_codon:yes stop_codon:yes gene_type:complete
LKKRNFFGLGFFGIEKKDFVFFSAAYVWFEVWVWGWYGLKEN